MPRDIPPCPSSPANEPWKSHGGEPPKPVAVLGAGGHAKVVISSLRAAGIPIAAVYDDNAERWGQKHLGVPITGPIFRLEQSAGLPGILAIGDPAARRRLAASLPLQWISVIHPQAWVDPSVRIGAGVVVFAGAVIQPDAVIEDHGVINTCASVDHDGNIGAFVNIGPGAHLAGNVTVREEASLGAGCTVIPGRVVGVGAIVGAGAVVIDDVSDHVTVVGCPARVIARRPAFREAA